LEVDRRIGRERMIKLEHALKRFELGRSERKKQRRSLLNIVLVGYTNVGKSTLMNQLTKSSVEADDRLFVTLDATSRLWTMDPVLKVILSDTVGFIRKLPHELIASFRSTLSEVREADLLFHVVDACHPHLTDLMKTVDGVIGSLADASVPSILVFNKIDELSPLDLKSLKRAYPDSLFVSALQKTGLDQLRQCVLQRFSHRIDGGTFLLPQAHMGMFYRIGEYGQILNSRHEDDGIHLEIRGLKERIEALRRDLPYLVAQPAD
jgi:GTP-binding protein HflX